MQTFIPVRSRTHPLRDNHGSSRRVIKQGEVLDPEDLCSRLEKHRLGEAFLDPQDLSKRLERHRQKERDIHRRRRERLEKNSLPIKYHHIPQTAAKDFVSTATPDLSNEKNVDLLSRPIIRSQKLARGTNTILALESALPQCAQDQDIVKSHMERLAERNPFQRSPAMEIAARIDKARTIDRLQQSNPETLNSLSNPSTRFPRPLSTGDLDGWDPSCIEARHPLFSLNDRHDWTQRDECIEDTTHRLRQIVAPLFRHADVVRRLSVKKDGSATKPIDMHQGEAPEEKGRSRRRSSFLTRLSLGKPSKDN